MMQDLMRVEWLGIGFGGWLAIIVLVLIVAAVIRGVLSR